MQRFGATGDEETGAAVMCPCPLAGEAAEGRRLLDEARVVAGEPGVPGAGGD